MSIKETLKETIAVSKPTEESILGSGSKNYSKFWRRNSNFEVPFLEAKALENVGMPSFLGAKSMIKDEKPQVPDFHIHEKHSYGVLKRKISNIGNPDTF